MKLTSDICLFICIQSLAIFDLQHACISAFIIMLLQVARINKEMIGSFWLCQNAYSCSVRLIITVKI
jgi:hypothetical protein